MLSDYDRNHVRELVENPSKDWFRAVLFKFINESDDLTRNQLRDEFSEEVNLVETEMGLPITAGGEQRTDRLLFLFRKSDMINRAKLLACFPFIDLESKVWR